MTTWYRKDLGDGILAVQPLGDIEARFRSSYAEAGSPAAMALFVRHASAGRLHCEVSVYLSPAAAEVAEAIAAAPCGPPSPAGLGLLAGSEEAWSLLFPNR